MTDLPAGTSDEDMRARVRALMEPMLQEAERFGMWLHQRYSGLWFSPRQLRTEQAAGKFCWGPINWDLRDPKDHLEALEKRARDAAAEAQRVKTALLSDGK
jgi:hypothetical protein